MTALDDADLQSQEKFVVVKYDRSNAVTSVNDARWNLSLANRGRMMQYQLLSLPSSYIQSVGQATVPLPVTKADWGWSMQGDTWKIHWTDSPSVAASFQELTRCGYRKDFCGRFKCLRSGLNCTASFV